MVRRQKMVVLGGKTFREIHQLIEAINASGKQSYEVIDLLDDNEELHGTDICGVNVKGPLSTVHSYPVDTVFAVAINNSKRRVQRMDILHNLGVPADRFPPLVHPSVVIDPSTKIGHGTQIYQFCTTAHGVRFGDFCMISPYSLFALDCIVGNGVLTGARVTVLGNVKIGACSFIGSGSVLMENTTIGPAAFIGAGSVVLQDVRPGHFTMGNPARQQIRNIKVPEDLLKTDKNE
jgi:sugar O-acyltransferase (sialic acid O-acetyltransferase NeuD family)